MKHGVASNQKTLCVCLLRTVITDMCHHVIYVLNMSIHTYVLDTSKLHKQSYFICR